MVRKYDVFVPKYEGTWAWDPRQGDHQIAVIVGLEVKTTVSAIDEYGAIAAAKQRGILNPIVQLRNSHDPGKHQRH